ncbi:hypothetical protein IFM46972_10140 [Aspergillus udagawae]|uniref:Oxidoreductase YusZ n=1 Tax=Aspergillus udagawae TaxID=91492 RepID=A0A8H3SAU8_9EURO|nr:hypothetical protein IFM46972_10140 [Aspergillus udagawae]
MAVWLITGCSSGLGKEIAKAALKHGEKVIATSRNASRLSELKSLGATTVSLNVNGTPAEIDATVVEAAKVHGTIDVLVNNAAYVLIGGIEETSDTEARAQFDTNVFGPLSVIRSVLPFMRAQKCGIIANIGSLGGYASNAGSGYYCATKFALAGLTEALRAEVGPLGIQATIIEPGYFRTNFLKADVDGKTVAAKTIDDYKPTIDNVKSMLSMYDGKQLGDPAKGAQVIVEALTGTARAAGKTLPARLLLGSDTVPYVASIQERQNKEMEEWKELIATTDHMN